MAREIPTEAQVLGWYTSLSNWGRWGPDDELGTLNTITPEKRRQAVGLVREGMVVWLQRSHSGALPRWRFEPAMAAGPSPQTQREFSSATTESGLFSGSDAAEERGKAFDDTGEEAREFITEESR